MMDRIFGSGSMPFMEKILYFTAARHRAIASNIANAETPNYKAIDVPEDEFKKELLKAATDSSFSFESTSNIEVKPNGGLDIKMVESKDFGIMKHSGNNVDIDREMVKLTKNAGLHNTVAQLLSQQFNLLKSVISERV